MKIDVRKFRDERSLGLFDLGPYDDEPGVFQGPITQDDLDGLETAVVRMEADKLLIYRKLLWSVDGDAPHKLCEVFDQPVGS